MTRAHDRFKCAILDDYQGVALNIVDWSPVVRNLDVLVFNQHLFDEDDIVSALAGCDIVVAMRERTPFPASLLDKLPDLKLLVTTGRWNPSIDLAAAADRGVLVCFTPSITHPTAELTFGLILAACRHIPSEDRNLREGGSWQQTIGISLHGKTLGVVGLGTVGTQVARIGKAFGMSIVAWSQNLAPETCTRSGAEYAAKSELFSRSDVVTIHLQLSHRTTGLVGSGELALMKPTAVLVNTSRGAIVNEPALVQALQLKRIRCAALDVFEREPLALDHPLRRLPNTVITPHLGYVTEDTYQVFFQGVVEAIRAWMDGTPIRILLPENQIDRSL